MLSLYSADLGKKSGSSLIYQDLVSVLITGNPEISRKFLILTLSGLRREKRTNKTDDYSIGYMKQRGLPTKTVTGFMS